MKNLIGACGVNCSECSHYIATQNDDNAYREATALRMREQYKIEIKAEDINCDGCLETGRHVGYCSMCKIRSCVLHRKIENCAYCEDYPCNDVEQFHRKSPQAKAYIDTLRAEL
jgi:hypothetical protein